MSLKGAGYIVGAWEHPTRKATDKSVTLLHAECAKGALDDAGLTKDDVDAYYCAGDAPGLGPMSMIDYMGLKVRHMDSTDVGGSSYQVAVGHALEAIATGRANVCLLTLAGRPRSEGMATGTAPRPGSPAQPEMQFEYPYGPATANMYAMCATRHMHEYGMLRDVVTVEDVVNSPMVASPLHRFDCCVISDGGGALIVTKPEIAKSLKRPLVKVIGVGEAPKNQAGGATDLTYSAARWSGPPAWEMAGIKPSDIKYASIYDSFTITVLMQLEDLGFCAKGEGGKFVSDGNLISGTGKLPFNTDGGGLCSNHPANRGGITKIIEAVRQLRGEAHKAVQVPNCDLAIAHRTRGSLGTRHVGSTVILERE